MDKLNQIVYQFRIIKWLLRNNDNKKSRRRGVWPYAPTRRAAISYLLFLIVQLQNLGLWMLHYSNELKAYMK